MQVKGGVLLSQGIQLPKSLEGGGRGMSKMIGSSLQRRQREWPIHLFRAITYNIHNTTPHIILEPLLLVLCYTGSYIPLTTCMYSVSQSSFL